MPRAPIRSRIDRRSAYARVMAAAAELDAAREKAAAQILHVFSYDDEVPTLARLHDEWMPQHGLTFNGPHHEVYRGDPRRAAPEKLRTVLRQPVRPG
jgi:hypothetical protein